MKIAIALLIAASIGLAHAQETQGTATLYQPPAAYLTFTVAKDGYFAPPLMTCSMHDERTVEKCILAPDATIEQVVQNILDSQRKETEMEQKRYDRLENLIQVYLNATKSVKKGKSK